MSRASLKAMVTQYVLTGGNRTKAVDVRTLLNAMIEELVNIPDDITSAPAVVAYGPGGQTNATLLTEVVSRVDTSALIGGSVKFTAAAENTKRTVINNSGKKIWVFPFENGYLRDTKGVVLAQNQGLELAHRNQITVYCYKNEAGIYSQI
jgi:hypothetical protein